MFRENVDDTDSKRREKRRKEKRIVHLDKEVPFFVL